MSGARRPLWRHAAILLVLMLAACQSAPPVAGGYASVRERSAAAKALWEEKCRTVAGEKIYRTVPDVAGVLLLKLRPDASDREWGDALWPGAAFALEARADGYITTFLGYEHAASHDTPVSANDRGYIGTDYQPRNPSNLPGYRYVDVIDEKDGRRYRYQLIQKARPSSKIGWIDTLLDKTLAPDPAPRYGVTFEDHVIPEERAIGLASSTVRVIDLETNEVLGEMLRYAWSNLSPDGRYAAWLSAYKCPGHPVGSGAATRKFVDQILIPIPTKGN